MSSAASLSGGPVGSPPGRRVFISYGRGDASAAAEWLAARLAERGYQAWVDRQLLAGQHLGQ